MRELQAGDGFELSREAKAGTIDGTRSKPFTRMTKQFRALLKGATAEFIHLSDKKPIKCLSSVDYLREIGISGVHFAPGVETAASLVDRGQRNDATTWTNAVAWARTGVAISALVILVPFVYNPPDSDSKGLLRGCLLFCLPPFTWR